MTNASVQRKDVLSQKEIEDMLKKASELKGKYFRLRAKALISIFRTGKRRAEVATLEVSDLEIKGDFLYITFTVVKKRRKKELSTRRTKRFPLKSPYARHIIKYWHHLLKHHPKSRYLFPRGKTVFNHAYILFPNQHLSGRQILRIIKQLNQKAWPHLFRETRGAEVVRADEKRLGEASLMTVYRVKRTLDLERETTAWNYINRYATETIGEEEETIE